jgi:excisionase family DNA binding protein
MRTVAGREQIEQSTISVSEVLAYLDTDRFMDLKEATKYLPLSERTIRQHLNEIPHFRYGKKIIFRRSELDRWMESFRVRDQDLEAAMKIAEEMLE